MSKLAELKEKAKKLGVENESTHVSPEIIAAIAKQSIAELDIEIERTRMTIRAQLIVENENALSKIVPNLEKLLKMRDHYKAELDRYKKSGKEGKDVDNG